MYFTFSPWLAIVASLVAAVWDLQTGRIPNLLTLPLVAAGLILAATSGSAALLFSAVGLGACALVPTLLYYLSHSKGIGGGDVKLFAALGALLGPTKGLEVEFGAFVLLASFALVRLAYRGQLFRVLQQSALLVLRPFLPKRLRRLPLQETLTELRMGPAIALACLSAFFLIDWVESWLA